MDLLSGLFINEISYGDTTASVSSVLLSSSSYVPISSDEIITWESSRQGVSAIFPKLDESSIFSLYGGVTGLAVSSDYIALTSDYLNTETYIISCYSTDAHEEDVETLGKQLAKFIDPETGEPLNDEVPPTSIATYSFLYDPIVFDEDITRTLGYVTLELPYSMNECSIPPNEFLTHQTMNLAIKNMIYNLDYMEDMNKVYQPPPRSYNGWMGVKSDEGVTSYGWNTSGENLAIEEGAYSDFVDIIVKDNMMFIIDPTTINIFNKETGLIISTRSYGPIDENFVNLVSICIDSDYNVYVLDSTKNRVYVFKFYLETLEFEFLYKWGELGGKSSRRGFNNPLDMFMDKSENLWFADTKNSCAKKFTKTGSWSKTIDVPSASLSVCADVNNNAYVLTQESITKVSSDGNTRKVFANKYPSEQPRKIRLLSGFKDFLYITYKDKIAKYTVNGNFNGIFRTVFTTDLDYYGMYFNQYKDVYIVSNGMVFWFSENIQILSTFKQSDTFWKNDELFVHKDEYIYPVVINRVFSRLWDNIEIFRRSLLGYFIDQDGSVLISTFTKKEYESMLLDSKSRMFVGINELVLSDVFNRNFNGLYNAMLDILQVMQDNIDPITDDEDDGPHEPPDDSGYNKIFEGGDNMVSESFRANRVILLNNYKDMT